MGQCLTVSKSLAGQFGAFWAIPLTTMGFKNCLNNLEIGKKPGICNFFKVWKKPGSLEFWWFYSKTWKKPWILWHSELCNSHRTGHHGLLWNLPFQTLRVLIFSICIETLKKLDLEKLKFDLEKNKVSWKKMKCPEKIRSFRTLSWKVQDPAKTLKLIESYHIIYHSLCREVGPNVKFFPHGCSHHGTGSATTARCGETCTTRDQWWTQSDNFVIVTNFFLPQKMQSMTSFKGFFST